MTVKSKDNLSADSSTQRYLPFSQIRDNVMIMKDGSSRLILKCSTINFLLKSQEEQDSIIISYQRFLNSLEFPVQILIRSSKMDIDAYITQLNWIALNHTNPKLQTQTYEYVSYLKKLIEMAQIMRKDFYLVVPHDKLGDTSVRDTSISWIFNNFMASINSWLDKTKVRNQIVNFDKTKKALNSRSSMIKSSLESIWIKAKELDKKELIKLVFDYYNPSMDSVQKYDWLNSDLM